MRILIICHFFPPLNSIASLRPLSWVKYWSEEGHEIIVLTTRKYGFDGPRDLELGGTEGSRVIELDYIPSPIVRALNNLRWYGVGSSSTGNPSSHWVVAKRVGAFLRKKSGLIAETTTPWIPQAVKKGKHFFRQAFPDLMVSTFGPPGTHIVAGWLKRRFPEVFWVADYRDLWSGNHINESWKKIDLLEKQIEQMMLSRADFMTTVSHPLADYLTLQFKKPVAVIENGFEPLEFENLPKERLFPDDGIFRLVYTGMIYPGKRDPSPLFHALKSLEEEGKMTSEQCKLLFFGGIRGNLQELIEDVGVKEWVELKGHVDRSTALRAQRDADALIFLEWNHPSAKGVLTGKIFEYIMTGKPILAIGIEHDTSESARFIKTSGAGKCLGTDIPRIKNYILELYKSKGTPGTGADPILIERYTRRHLALKFLNALPLPK